MNITVENGIKELVIRQGEAEQLYSKKKVAITGTIEAPFKFLEKRNDLIEYAQANMLVNREGLNIILVTNEHLEIGETITGVLKKTQAFDAFGINSGKNWISRELGQFIKMNRTCFESKDIANDLAAKLNDFKAKIDKELEHKDDNRGNARILKDQKIKEINIPDKFNLEIPIFKGAPKATFEVEIYINADDLTIQLVSPDASDIIARTRDEVIDNEIDRIKEICPKLTIIEI